MENSAGKPAVRTNLLTILEGVSNSYKEMLKKLIAFLMVLALVLLLSLSIVFPIWLLATGSRIAFNITVLALFSVVLLAYIVLKVVNNPKTILPSILRKLKALSFILLFLFLLYIDILLLQTSLRIAGIVTSIITFLWFGYIIHARRSEKNNSRR